MCLLVFAYDCHPHYRFILAANRDEYHKRPTEKAHFWTSFPWVLAGRDLEMLGTWMGITRTGRFAAITNYRDLSTQVVNAKSRGALVSNFLSNNEAPMEYMLDVIKNRTIYNGFNLLVGDLSSLVYFNKHSSSVEVLKPGIYGLSNHYLNTPWPKVQKSKQALADCLENRTFVKPQAILEILTDTEQAQVKELPNTGLSEERERMLSSIFIQGTDYGTRSSTVLMIDRRNHVIFKEKSFTRGRTHWAEVNYEFDLK